MLHRAGLGLHPFPDQSGPRSCGPSGAHRSPVAPSAGTGVLHRRRGNLAALGRDMAARQPGPRPACRAPFAGHSQPGGRGDSGQHCCCHQRHPDPNPDNNQATERTPIDTAADLAVLKQVQPARVHPGETLTYTLQVTNAGPSAAQDVVLQDPLPAAILSPVFSADGRGNLQPWSGTYVLRTLLPGTTATLLLQGRWTPPRQPVPWRTPLW